MSKAMLRKIVRVANRAEVAAYDIENAAVMYARQREARAVKQWAKESLAATLIGRDALVRDALVMEWARRLLELEALTADGKRAPYAEWDGAGILVTAARNAIRVFDTAHPERADAPPAEGDET